MMNLHRASELNGPLKGFLVHIPSAGPPKYSNHGLNTQNEAYMGHDFGYFAGPGLGFRPQLCGLCGPSGQGNHRYAKAGGGS